MQVIDLDDAEHSDSHLPAEVPEASGIHSPHMSGSLAAEVSESQLAAECDSQDTLCFANSC